MPTAPLMGAEAIELSHERHHRMHRHKYEIVGSIPDATPYGPQAVQAAAELLEARIREEETSEAVQALTAGEAGPSSFINDPAFNRGRPANAEAAAIEADRTLMRAALEAGEDVDAVGTPNLDEYRRQRRNAELRDEITKEQLLEADHNLAAVLNARAPQARPILTEAAHRFLDDYRRAVDAIDRAHTAAYAAFSALGYCNLVAETEYVPRGTRLGFDARGTALIKHPGRMLTLGFDDIVSYARADLDDLAAKVGPLDTPAIDDDSAAENADSEAEQNPTRDTRFNRDVATRRRQRAARRADS